MAPGRTDLPVDWNVDREFFPRIPHYYGDIARQIMLGAVAIMMLSAPFYSDSLQAEFPFEIVAAIILVAFAALTNPIKRSIVLIDAMLTGAAAATFALWAFLGYGQVDSVAFMLRDVIALLFLFAFYFSLKTLRAMILHQIGMAHLPTTLQDVGAHHSSTLETAEEGEETDPSADPLRYEKAAVHEIMRHDRGD